MLSKFCKSGSMGGKGYFIVKLKYQCVLTKLHCKSCEDENYQPFQRLYNLMCQEGWRGKERNYCLLELQWKLMLAVDIWEKIKRWMDQW